MSKYIPHIHPHRFPTAKIRTFRHTAVSHFTSKIYSAHSPSPVSDCKDTNIPPHGSFTFYANSFTNHRNKNDESRGQQWSRLSVLGVSSESEYNLQRVRAAVVEEGTRDRGLSPIPQVH